LDRIAQSDGRIDSETLDCLIEDSSDFVKFLHDTNLFGNPDAMDMLSLVVSSPRSTEENSSAPDIERRILAEHSYGRQLGRVIDAVAALIAELPESNQNAEAFTEFQKLRHDIDAIKSEAAARRSKK
jgi:hypothetical protein